MNASGWLKNLILYRDLSAEFDQESFTLLD